MLNTTCCTDAAPEPSHELLYSVVQLPAQSVLLPSETRLPGSYAEKGIMEMVTGVPAAAVPLILVSVALRVGEITKAIVMGLGSVVTAAAGVKAVG